MVVSTDRVEERDTEAPKDAHSLTSDTNVHSALSKSWGLHPLLYIFSVAFIIRTVAAVSLMTFSGSLVLDDQTYWAIARDIVNGLSYEWDAYEAGLYAQTRAFSLPLAAVYALSGGNDLAGQLLVASIGAGLAVIVYLLARRMLGPKLAFIPALIIALLPSQILWSSLILKDAFVWFAMALISWLFVNRSQHTNVHHLFLWAVALAASGLFLAYLRPHTTVVVAWALALTCLLQRARLHAPRVFVVLVIVVMVPWLRGLGPVGINFALNATPVTEIREANAIGARSAIVSPRPESTPPEVKIHADAVADLQAQKAELELLIGQTNSTQKRRRLAERLRHVSELLAVEHSALDAAAVALPRASADPVRDVGVRYIARGISVMVAEPYPWDASTSPSFTMAKFETIVWYPILFLAALGLLPALSRHQDVMLLPMIMGAGTMLLYALTEGNVGTAFRHRGEFVWVIVLLAGLGLVYLSEKRSGSVGSRTRS